MQKRVSGEEKLVDATRAAAATEPSVYAVAKKVSTYPRKVMELATRHGIKLPPPKPRRGGSVKAASGVQASSTTSPSTAMAWTCTMKPVVPNGHLTADKLARLVVAASDAGLTVQDIVAAGEAFSGAAGWKNLWATAKAGVGAE